MEDDAIDKSTEPDPEQDPGSPRPGEGYLGLV